MARPRHSVLSLFDPLNGLPSTPRRDVTTPDSDKENNGKNEITMSTYFNRTYARKEPVVVQPKRRLVDVGDVTVDESVRHDDEDDFDDYDENDEGNVSLLSEPDLDDDDLQDVTIHGPPALPPARAAPTSPTRASLKPSSRTPTSPRTPLAEIVLEMSPPPARKKFFKRDDAAATASASSAAQPDSARAPPHSPLANVINGINFPRREPGSARRVHVESDADDTDDDQENAPCGSLQPSLPIKSSLMASTAHLTRSPTKAMLTNITVCPPSPPSPSAHGLPSKTALMSSTARLDRSPTRAMLTNVTLLSASTMASSTASMDESVRRRPTPTTSSIDPRRSSADLQSSFNLQLQNAESSFDLLNDKISFLGSDNSFLGGECSFLGGAADMGDDEFDLKEEERLMEIQAREAGGMSSAKNSPTLKAGFAAVENTGSPESTSSGSSKGSRDATPQASSLRRRFSDAAARSPLGSVFKTKAKTPSPQSSEPIHVPNTPTHTSPTSVIDVHTPLAPSNPKPVPALRIVKRALKTYEHTKADSATSTSSCATDTDTDREGNALTRAEPRMLTRRRSSIAPPAPAPVKRRPSVAPPAPAPPQPKHRPMLAGIQRPPKGVAPAPSRPPAVAARRPVPPAANAAATKPAPAIDAKSRLQRPGSALGGQPSKIGGASGLRPPSRYAPTAETKPKPAGGVPKTMATGVGTARTISAAASRMPAPGSRLKMPTGSLGSAAGATAARGSGAGARRM
ncbi:hypothetical protein PLICRDRAFT_57160 [Plicaturopsis crispa FD-325 SS-3]|uniref:Unplaced genomic scaffold PLICRscaffold_15, whole genome shotgun sequence n=1 Tax=Plicaturopsis crispa FD-325 SS-3 TaxID=944288 RepID=A0A0C9TAC5_PLICR|nr:hypothetical protein PLICRDRAFT_57160 [Plicaturopsis crispa FD-325 SS-3]